MDKPNPTNMMYLAPGAASAAYALHFPGAMEETTQFPAVDDHLVEPGSGMEMFRGELFQAIGSDPPHAREQCNIATVINLDVAPGYAASTELLTRFDHDSDFATDACICKEGIDPETGSRYLEEIAFEVQNTQRDKHLTERARMLVRRGVRRVFAVKVREDDDGTVHAGPVKEWLAAEDRWGELDPESEIVDRCFKHPIKVKALIDATEARDQVFRGFVADNHPLLLADRQKAVATREQELSETHARELAAREQELSEAHTREITTRDEAHARELAARDERERLRLRTMIVDFCDLLSIDIPAERRARMEGMTAAELDALRGAIRTGRRWPPE